MDIFNDFDKWQDALRKIDLQESTMPYVRGKLLTENIDIYAKVQKLLNCRDMECCHPYLYNLDIEELDESEASKVNNLYKLGVDKGFIEDETNEDDEEKDAANECGVVATDDRQFAPVVQPPVPAPQPKQVAPASAFTVMYSAMKDGQIKTGEAYSNSINTRSAKADVISKLERAGYSSISILAIEAGDPDMVGCDNTFCKQPDIASVPDYSMTEDDMIDGRSHNGHIAEDEQVNEWLGSRPGKYNYRGKYEPSAADMAAWRNTQDHEFMSKRDDAKAKEAVKKAFDEANNEVGDQTEPTEIKTFLNDTRREIEATRKVIEKTGDTNAVANYDKILTFLDDYSKGKITEADISEAKKPSTGIKTLVRGLVKILLTLIKLTSISIGFSGKFIVWITKLLATGADKINANLKDSEQVDEAADKEEDAAKTDDKEADEKKDSTEEEPEEKVDDKEDAAAEEKDDAADTKAKDDKKEEKAEEPDEKLKDEPADKEDADDKKDGKELDAAEKATLKDSYKKAFKAAMLKCKYFDKSFNDLSLEQKVEFFTQLSKAWNKKAEPTDFMTDKEVDQLEKIFVKK